jgi:hypothetical protein
MSADTDELLKAVVAWYEAPGFMHHAMTATLAPIHRYPPDPPTRRSLDAARRVISAYHRARADDVSSGTSMWTHIEQRHVDFLAALDNRDADRVQAHLGAMFTNGLAYGIARLSPDVDRDARYTQLRCTDAVRSLAEACGAERVISLEQQGAAAQQNALTVDLDRLLADTETIAGLDLACAAVGSAYGCRIANKVVNVDSLLHSCTAYRLRQLGAASTSTVIEIGGGYGCLADLCYRAGLHDYAIYDLPWVNALQGYFLIMTLPDGAVSLYGESAGGMKVLPFWRIHDLCDQSTDYVVNINSLPEMDGAIARDYLVVIARILRRTFLSINQEGMAPSVGGAQHWVSRMAAERGALICHSRQRGWMEQGYVEEVYGRRADAPDTFSARGSSA